LMLGKIKHLMAHQDEVDINLNPIISAGSVTRGQQGHFATQAQNQKYICPEHIARVKTITLVGIELHHPQKTRSLSRGKHELSEVER
ncbi:hypothetical protein D5074_00410, partial [Pectobacterium polaris]